MKKFITIVALLVAVFSSGMAQTCDTLVNLQSVHDTATLILVDTTGGYMSGNNAYGDAAIAEAFPVADTGLYLTTAILNFGYVTINPTDSNNIVTIYSLDNMGATVFGNGAPGNAIDSAQVTLGMIALAVSENKGLLVHFTSTSELLTDTVFVGLVLPVNTGDTVALLTNTFNGTDGDGYVLALDPSGQGFYTWDTYNDNYGVTGASLGNYIGVVICTAPNLNAPFANFGGGLSSNCTPSVASTNDQSGPPAPTYISWSFGDGNTANGANASDVYTAQGAYLIQELVANDTGSVVEVFIPSVVQAVILGSPAVTVTVLPSTDGGADAEAYVTVVSATGHYFTNWYDSTGIGNNLLAIGDTLDYITNGLYLVNVQDQNGCAVNDSVFVEPLTTGIIKLSNAQSVNVYPNPATDVLNLVWSSNANAEISVVDLNGNVISTLITNGDMKTVYNIQDLASGAYILRITDKASGQQQSRLFTKF